MIFDSADTSPYHFNLDFEEAIKQALAGASDTPFEISVRLAAGRSHSK